MDDQSYLNPPPMLETIERETERSGFNMASDRQTGSLLRMLAASKRDGDQLELGTGSGLSTAWILDGMGDAGTLETVDNDADIQAIARAHLDGDPRLTIHTGDGDRFIVGLVEEGRSFDLVFADTWPGKLRLLDETLAMVRPGGFYIVDDMLPQSNWDELELDYDHPAAIAEITRHLESHADFCVTKLAWATGIIIATRR